MIQSNIDNISEKQWTELSKCNTANFFQSKVALHFFESVGTEVFTFALEKDKEIVVFLSGIIQKEKGVKAGLTSRAIIYGGPIISENAEEKNVLEVLAYTVSYLKKKAIYVEMRNLNDYGDYKEVFKKAGFEYVPHLNFHLDCEDEAVMRKRMSSSKLRQVKKSLKQGAEIKEAQDQKEIEAYYAILENLYKTKVKTPLPNLDYFIRMWKDKVAKFFLVIYKEEVLGGIVCPVLDNKVIYEWFVCGKDGAYKNIYPSILATWAAMDYAVKNDIPRFDFMGAGKPDQDYGVREFKSKFGGEQVEHGRFLNVTQPLLYKVGKTAVKILKSI
ncbi:FemAB family protein [Aquimarina amphilecti]|uniref:FemAB family protein n=1 Tax=Aquimarina amphilecti TaxID=1038014 RepID=A0A1H7MI84_AQUAM|nr:peptidoglycan bridge formation glycyltransferase FemA/FemB family protein [Aquimarina amphilecti]SEL10779.1 FemAB family protein [Aquimarina amphilecti]